MGLFLILPVLALHANEYPDATPLMIGLALGIYGLTQAMLQIPFGMASDKLGRKPVIIAGILVFAIGCVIAAFADTIVGVAIGRAVQGAGAISAAVFALVGDLIDDRRRNKAMAFMGVSIGLAFTLSLVLSPILDSAVGLSGLFWVAFALALVGLILILFVVPDPESLAVPKAEQGNFRSVLVDRRLLRFYSGSFVLHISIVALFVAFPQALVEAAGIASDEIWKYYVPVFMASVAGMAPLIRFSAGRGRTSIVIAIAALATIGGFMSMYFGINTSPLLLFGFWLFFVGFNTLEALFPATVVRHAPAQLRGVAMGGLNTCTFLGAFFGGVLGGAVNGRFGDSGVFVFCALLVALWALCANAFRVQKTT